VAIKTNNYAEGLHQSWNEAAGRKLRFYRLAEFLRHISSVVTLKIRLLSHDKIKRYARKSSQIKGRILFDNWDDYLRNELDTLQLMDKIVADVASLLPSKISPFTDRSFAGESMDCYVMDLVDEQKILVE
jgi:hypothetical protein